jgi:hypothetical protein
MTDTSGLHQSLAAMGFLELALAFIALACYALVLNAALGPTGRTVAAATAAVAAGGFTVMTDPWMNGVGLIAIGIAGLGVFVAALWAVSAACRAAALAMQQPADVSTPGRPRRFQPPKQWNPRRPSSPPRCRGPIRPRSRIKPKASPPRRAAAIS